MPYTPDFKPGGSSTFTIAGVPVRFKNFKVNKTYANDDVTTTGDYNPGTGLVNKRALPISAVDKISFDAVVDGSTDVLATLEAGNALLNNCVFAYGTGKSRTYTQIALDTIDLTSAVAGANVYSVTATSNGPYVTV